MGWLWGLLPIFNIFFSYGDGNGRRKPSSRQIQCQTYVLFDCLQLLEPTEIYLAAGLSSPQLGQQSQGAAPRAGRQQEDKEVLDQFSSLRIERRARFVFRIFIYP